MWRADLRLFGSEMRLITSRRRNQAGLLVLAAVPVILAFAVRASDRGGRGGSFFSLMTENGFFVAFTALIIEMTLLLPLAIATLSGDAVAGEAGAGTLRYLLTTPVARTRLLLLKYASLVAGAFIGAATVAVAGLVAGAALFGIGPVTLLSGTEIPLTQALVRLGGAVLYLTAGLAALAAIGLFVSTLTEQPVAATISLTVIVTAMWIVDNIVQLDWLHPWLLVHSWPALGDFVRDPVHLDEIRRGLLVDLGYVVVALLAAWARFTGKDVTS